MLHPALHLIYILLSYYTLEQPSLLYTTATTFVFFLNLLMKPLTFTFNTLITIKNNKIHIINACGTPLAIGFQSEPLFHHHCLPPITNTIQTNFGPIELVCLGTHVV